MSTFIFTDDQCHRWLIINPLQNLWKGNPTERGEDLVTGAKRLAGIISGSLVYPLPHQELYGHFRDSYLAQVRILLDEAAELPAPLNLPGNAQRAAVEKWKPEIDRAVEAFFDTLAEQS